jgi:mannitol-1-phosphate/altronate dehydrogenase
MDMSGRFDLAATAAAPTGVAVDRAQAHPGIVNFGTGRRLRGALAPLIDRLMCAGYCDYGIIAVSQSEGPMFAALSQSEGRFTLIERDGSTDHSCEIGAIISVLGARRDRAAVVAAIADPRVTIITLTVSQADLRVTADGQLNRHDHDIALELAGCDDPVTPVGQIVAGLNARRLAGLGGVTIFVCDNVAGSNLWIASLVDAMAVERDVRLADWIAMNVRFPAVYGDRLVVAEAEDSPSDSPDIGVERFVHWVIEDNLGAERAELEDVGVAIVPDVQPFLVMRERLLEGSLCLVGYAGTLAGHSTLDQAMRDPPLQALLQRYLEETSALLPPVKGIDGERYLAEVRDRYANSALTIPLWRLCWNGSRKVQTRLFPTIIAAMRRGASADAAASAVAAWLVHCMSPDNQDPYAEKFWEFGEAAGDDWPRYVGLACDFNPVFGSIGKNPDFRALIVRGVRSLPGLESLVDG